MEFLVLLLLVGCSSASLRDAYEKESLSAAADFAAGLKESVPLHAALGIENNEDLRRFERDLKEELKKHIKDAFDRLIEKVNKEVENGKEINQEALRMLKDLHEKMKNLQISDKDIVNGIDKMKEKINQHLKQILEKMGIIDKRSVDNMHSIENFIGDLNLQRLFLKLKEMVWSKMNAETAKNVLSKILSHTSQSLCIWMTNKSKQRVLNLFDRFILEDEVDKRAVGDSAQEIKDALEDIEEDIETKLKRFRDWLKELIHAGLTKSEKRIEKVKEILNMIISQSKNMSKKEISDVLGYLGMYEEDFHLFSDEIQAIIREYFKNDISF